MSGAKFINLPDNLTALTYKRMIIEGEFTSSDEGEKVGVEQYW
jgi:hypothetical protein